MIDFKNCAQTQWKSSQDAEKFPSACQSLQLWAVWMVLRCTARHLQTSQFSRNLRNYTGGPSRLFGWRDTVFAQYGVAWRGVSISMKVILDFFFARLSRVLSHYRVKLSLETLMAFVLVIAMLSVIVTTMFAAIIGIVHYSRPANLVSLLSSSWKWRDQRQISKETMKSETLWAKLY